MYQRANTKLITNNAQHWDNIYTTKAEHQLGWYEQDCQQTLNFIAPVTLSEQSQVFIAGAGTSTIVDQLHRLGCHLILNDLSQSALSQLEKRIGSQRVEFHLGDVALPFASQITVDFWFDRAVLHFLLTDAEINGYFNNLKSSVVKGGFVLLAEFSTSGAQKCAGLPLRQYSIDDMQSYLGEEFSLISDMEYIFTNPFGEKKPYIYGLFQRKN